MNCQTDFIRQYVKKSRKLKKSLENLETIDNLLFELLTKS